MKIGDSYKKFFLQKKIIFLLTSSTFEWKDLYSIINED